MRLDDVVELVRGTTYKGALLGESGPYLLGLASIAKDGGFRDDNLKTYGGESPEKLLLFPGDIYVSLKDVTQSALLLGAVARVPDAIRVGRLTQDTLKLVFKSTSVPVEYVYWLLRTPQYRAYCKANATGTTTLGLSRDDFLAFEVPEYDSGRQALVELLESIEAKIELNRQTTRTLEELAQRLFKSWFVDFDPVRAKLAGRQSAHTSSEIADLFPDRLVESPLGPIPEGWEIRRIEDIVTIKGGATPSTKEEAFWDGGEYHWATPKDLSRLQQKVLIATARKITSAGVEKISSGQLPAGTVLMSSRAPVGYLALADMPVSINQGFIAMICDQGVPNTLVLHWAEANMDVIKSNAGGSTFAEISKKQFRPLEVIVPPAPLLQAFDEMAVDWFQRVSQLARENVTLAQLRDRLLPKLISGELTILGSGV